MTNITFSNPNRQIARAAGTVMVAFLFSQLIGLIAKILIASSFKAGAELDAFYAANQPSETLSTIMAGGILVSSFIPVFVKFLVKEDRKSAWHLASATLNIIILIMTVLTGLEILLAGPIVKYILGAGFSPEKQILTIDLLRIQAASIVFFGMSGLVIGILNSHQRFFFSALAPAMYQIGLIIGTLFLAPKMGIYGLAWGVVLGSALNLLIQIPPLIATHWKYTFILGHKNAAVKEVFLLMAPRMFGAAAVQIMVWVNKSLASFMVSGSLYSLTLGFTIMMMAEIAIGQSIATASMPTFSAQYAEEKYDDIRSTLATTLRSVLLLSLPAAVGLILLRMPIVTLIFQRGEFTVNTTYMVSWALAWYSTGLVFHALLEVLVRAYYAMHDTKNPVLIGTAAMMLSIGLSFLFSNIFSKIGWLPLGGLALAVSISTFLEVSTLLLILRQRIKGIHGNRLIQALLSSILGCIGMTAGIIFWFSLSLHFPVIVVTLVGIILGGIIYGSILYFLRVNEVHSLILFVRNKLSKNQLSD